MTGARFLGRIGEKKGMTFVVVQSDECNSEDRAYLWNILKAHSPRIKLVTIYSDYDYASGINYLEIPPLDEKHISKIIQSYNIPIDRSDIWARECSGSPRVAHVIGSNLLLNPEDILKPPSTVNIWERYIVGNDIPYSDEVAQRRVVLRYISLFKRFGYGNVVIEEALTIAKLVQDHDPQITWPRFREIIQNLIKRKILQGENTLYITPKLLHIRLWIEWWDTHGVGFDLDSLELPPKLLEWFFEMFEYAAGSPAASKVVKNLLGEKGPFQQNKGELLKNRIGAHFFYYLVESEPESALQCLKNTIGKWTRDELFHLTDVRRDLVWSLDRIAKWRNLFADAARLLLKLGEAENETWLNNASGVFTDLFNLSIRQQLSKTEASPAERFPIIKEALESDSRDRRLLGLRACERSLDPDLGGIVTKTHRIIGPEPDLWFPKTYGELFAAYKDIWLFLYDKLKDLYNNERNRGIQILVNSARYIGRIQSLSPMVIETLRNLFLSPGLDKEEVLQVIIHVLKSEGDHFPDPTRNEWIQLQQELEGNDFPSLLRRYVGMNIIEDRIDENEEVIEGKDSKILELAQYSINNIDTLIPELDWLVTIQAKNGYQFGYTLGGIDENFSLLPNILRAQENSGSNGSVYLLSGYLRIYFEKHGEKWEELMDSIAKSDKMKNWLPELIRRSGRLSKRSALRLLNLYKDDNNIYIFTNFIYGPFLADLSEDIFLKWICTLISSEKTEGVLIALALFSQYYLYKHPTIDLPKKATIDLLTDPILFEESEAFRRDQMASYHWELLGKTLFMKYPDIGIDLVRIIMENAGKEKIILSNDRSKLFSIVGLVANKYPREVWGIIVKYIELPLDTRAFWIIHWLRGDTDPGALIIFENEIVWNWVEENIESRAWFLAYFVPKDLFHDEDRMCWAREVLVRYGDLEDVRRNLISNFSSESWWGRASLHLENKKLALLDFRKNEEDSKVLSWIDEYILMINDEIERARILEEREEY